MRSAIFFFIALVISLVLVIAAGAGDDPKTGDEPKALCLVIDSTPPVLGAEKSKEIASGLCSGPNFIRPQGEEAEKLGKDILIALALGNMTLLNEKMKSQGASRLLYSLHSENGDLMIHGTYLYDRESGFSVAGGKAYDRAGAVKNADKKWAETGARSTLAALGARRMADVVSKADGPLGVQTAAILLHPEKPTQFIKPRGGYDVDSPSVLRAIISRSAEGYPESSANLARAALEFLTLDDAGALAAFDLYAKDCPGVSADIMRVNLLNSLHRFAEADKAARETDERLGFEFFLFSKAIALAGLGRKDDAAVAFGKFKTRTGPEWEKPVLEVIQAYADSGDAENLARLSELFLASSPSEKNRDFINNLAKTKP